VRQPDVFQELLLQWETAEASAWRAAAGPPPALRLPRPRRPGPASGAADQVLDLFRRFGRAVLGVELNARCLAPAFRLQLLKQRFDPPLDAPDMERVRVRSLHLAYAGRAGRRRVKLETLAGDSQDAISELLREHGGPAGVLEDLTVLYAELEVRLDQPVAELLPPGLHPILPREGDHPGPPGRAYRGSAPTAG
jgi:hypothetical protein